MPICFASATAIYTKRKVFNKETSSNILIICFYGIELLSHLLYDEIYYRNSTSVCNGVFPTVKGVGGVFLSISEIYTSICLHYDSSFL